MTTAADHCGLRVLVVEDEALIREMLVDALADRGCVPHAVANATDALRHLAQGRACDVLFTDIDLAGGVDGVALSWAARGICPHLPVVYASGSFGGMQQFRAVPGAQFVRKPYCLDLVAAMLSRIAADPARDLIPA